MNPYAPPTHAPHPQGGWMVQAPVAGPATPFKFTFVRNNRAASVFAKDGLVTPAGLVLDGKPLPMQHVRDTKSRELRLSLTLAYPESLHPELQGYVMNGVLVLEVRSPGARPIEMAIDRIASHAEAEAHRQQLFAAGRGHEFRVVPCPTCQATIDLSSMPQTPYYYCRFCGTVHHQQGPLRGAGAYRTCDECAMFDRNQVYTEFYFYFLFIVYGFMWSRRHLCDNCARDLFWKVFLINFVFVLGVPSAVWLRIKAETGRDPALMDLAGANRLASKGRAAEARQRLARLHSVLPDRPGLHVNEAVGHARAGDRQAASACLQAALAACPSYLPAHEMMQRLVGGPQAGWPAAPELRSA
jgi:hypothetical protein